MAAIPQQEIRQEDLKDPQLSNLNNILRQIIFEINRLSGYNGPIQPVANIDLQGKYKIVNPAGGSGVTSLNGLQGDVAVKSADSSVTITTPDKQTVNLKVP